MKPRTILDAASFWISELLFGFAGLLGANQVAFRIVSFFHLAQSNLLTSGLIPVILALGSILALYRLAPSTRLQAISREAKYLSPAGATFCLLSVVTGAVLGILVFSVTLMMNSILLAFRQ